jgi:hypothetical protein
MMSSNVKPKPSFQRHPKEAEIIGRLVVGFGDIEFAVCRNAGLALNMLDAVLRALYKQASTSGRIDTADALMQSAFGLAGLADSYAKSIGMVRYCQKIRDQYAHCDWADSQDPPYLYFADLRASAESPSGQFDLFFHHVDVSLLKLQEAYFSNTIEWLEFLKHDLAVRQGHLASHNWLVPPVTARPPLHNPPSQHVPPWVSEDGKALHVARALAAHGGPPTAARGQGARDKARAEKARHANRRSAEEEPRTRDRSPDEPREDYVPPEEA